jgi:serine/threonine-protein kinase
VTDTRRWKRIEALFHEALDLDPGARDVFLRDACGDDRQLYDEVNALLDADAEPDDLLDGNAVDAVADLVASRDIPTGLAPGTRIGAYRLEREIGSGGMGAVYLAERADGQFEQRVALKVIKRGMDSASILARFHAERSILARLQHPNIANLLDGGVTDEGLPYFTLEYVDGKPITHFCDQQRLTVEERLRLFQSVCAAVQYAHNNLIVHRDLKPSNILVTQDGHVKLLDFGIARVLDDNDDGLTRSGQRIMTPAYASPEQVTGAPVTTASDVYSLGVVLYELLCGRHPHRDTTSTPAELEKAIASTPAERPSRLGNNIDVVGSVASGTAKPGDTIAGARRLTPARLVSRLEGDLDTICLMALRKEAERRYPSVNQLSGDIERHLSGRPVSARPDTMRYRVGKFVRRNRAGVGAVAGLVLLVAAFTIVYTTRLAAERDRARLEARKAAAVSSFLSGLFEAADPYTARGETITARELLDKGAERVHSELAGQPDVQAEMLSTIGQAYANLGVLDEGVALLKESRDLRVGLVGDRHPTVIRASVNLMEILVITGDFAEADSLGRLAVAAARDVPNRRYLASAVGSLAQVVNYQGDYRQAEELYRESIDLFHELYEPDSAWAMPVHNNLALLLHEQSRYAAADSFFRGALAAQEKLWGKRHPETATTRYNYAQLLSDQGQMSEARAMWDEVLDTDRALYPEGHPAIAYTLSAYGRLMARLGDFEEATRLQREALAIRRKNHGDDHPEVGYSFSSLGLALQGNGYYDEAETCFRESYAIHLAAHGKEHPVLATLKSHLGQVQYDRGDYAAADTSFASALALGRKIHGERGHNMIAVAYLRRAAVQSAMGNQTEAEALLREGMAMADRIMEEGSMGRAYAEIREAEIDLSGGRVERADSLFAGSLALMRDLEVDAPHRPRDCNALLGLGRCALSRGDATTAERYFREALNIDREYLRDGHPDTARAQIALAAALIAQRRNTEAETLLREAVAALQDRVRPGQVDLVEARRLLAATGSGSYR